MFTMAVEEILNATAPDVILEVARIGKWIQAIGLIVIFWIIIQIINYYYLRKRMKAIAGFEESIERIEKKVDNLSKKVGK